MFEIEKAPPSVQPAEHDAVSFSIICGTLSAAYSIADFLQLRGLSYNTCAEPTLLLDIPRGFALHCLETFDLPLDSLVVATWNTCPEYVEDLWEMQPAILLVTNGLGEDIPLALARAMQGDRYRVCGGPASLLTPVERRVLRLMARGYPNQTIAERLNMQLQTVKNTLANIYQKLGLRNRSEALLYYWGILSAFECESPILLERFSEK